MYASFAAREARERVVAGDVLRLEELEVDAGRAREVRDELRADPREARR